jgi:hypothetical protein
MSLPTLRLRLLALLLVLGMPSMALADDPEPEVSDQVEEPAGPDPMHQRWDRLIGAEITGGIDTPFGVVGGLLNVTPLRMLRLDLGGGVSRDGGRFGGGATLVLPQDHFALTIRIGFAGGPLSWESERQVHIREYWGFAGFFNSQIGLEYRFDEGILIRLYAGVETTLNDHSDSCSTSAPDASINFSAVCSPTANSHPARLFAGLSVGYMFDIYP